MFGDIIAIYNSYGARVARYVYDAYGVCKVMSSGGAVNTDKDFIGNINPFRYRGYYYDVETKLYYLQSRYYDPAVGRFLNADSLEYLDPETAGGLNLYAYCNCNPVMYVDPTGTASLLLFFVLAFAIIGAASGGIIAYNAAVQQGDSDNQVISATIKGALVGSLIGAAAGYAIYYAPEIIGNILDAFTLTLTSGAALSYATSGAAAMSMEIVGVGVIATGMTALIELMKISFMSKPNSGRMRYNDGRDINPNTGKPFQTKEEAQEYYKTLTDPKEKAKFKQFMKGKKWRRNHLDAWIILFTNFLYKLWDIDK